MNTGATISSTVKARFTDCFPESLAQLLDIALGHRVLTGSMGWKAMLKTRAKYHLGQIVRHRKHPFRGGRLRCGPAILQHRGMVSGHSRGQPPSERAAVLSPAGRKRAELLRGYVSEQNLIADYSGEPISHPPTLTICSAPFRTVAIRCNSS